MSTSLEDRVQAAERNLSALTRRFDSVEREMTLCLRWVRLHAALEPDDASANVDAEPPCSA